MAWQPSSQLNLNVKLNQIKIISLVSTPHRYTNYKKENGSTKLHN